MYIYKYQYIHTLCCHHTGISKLPPDIDQVLLESISSSQLSHQSDFSEAVLISNASIKIPKKKELNTPCYGYIQQDTTTNHNCWFEGLCDTMIGSPKRGREKNFSTSRPLRYVFAVPAQHRDTLLLWFDRAIFDVQSFQFCSNPASHPRSKNTSWKIICSFATFEDVSW